MVGQQTSGPISVEICGLGTFKEPGQYSRIVDPARRCCGPSPSPSHRPPQWTFATRRARPCVVPGIARSRTTKRMNLMRVQVLSGLTRWILGFRSHTCTSTTMPVFICPAWALSDVLRVGPLRTGWSLEFTHVQTNGLNCIVGEPQRQKRTRRTEGHVTVSATVKQCGKHAIGMKPSVQNGGS